MNDTEAGRLEYDPPTRLRRLPSWLTSQVARRAERLVSEALAQEDARRQHFVVLSSLSEQTGLTFNRGLRSVDVWTLTEEK